MTLVYNVNFDIASLFILFLIRLILRAQYLVQSKANKLFRLVVDAAFISCVFDIATAYTISYAANIPLIVNLLLNTLYFLFAYLCTFTGTQYIYESLHWYPSAHKFFDYFISIFYAALLIANLFTGIIFSFNGHQYNKGPLYYSTFGASLLLLIHIGIVFIVKHSLFNRRKLFLNSFFVIMPFLFVGFQFFFPNYLLTCFCSCMVVFIMMFTLETPDFLELSYLRKFLESEVKQQTKQIIERERMIENMSLETVQALAEAIDEKDDYTKGHSVRVASYSLKIGKAMGLPEEDLRLLHLAALLHDVGKIGIPDSVLQKPSKLDDDEREIIKLHTIKGGKILHNVKSLTFAEDVAIHHHENFDGTGYPYGKKGTEIPFFARIVSIADSYDAMSTKRVYRDRLSNEQIREQFIKFRGTQFDPEILDVFLTIFESEDF